MRCCRKVTHGRIGSKSIGSVPRQSGAQGSLRPAQGTALASLVFIGNIDYDIETVVRTSHLFTPFPLEMQDLAFLDRFHCYLPGWEIPKMHPDFFGDHYGFVVDYLAEFCRDLRQVTYATAVDKRFRFGSALNTRDERAVRKMLSGLIKLTHPDGEFSKEELEEYLILAIEMRRRVKEQLRKMGGLEYWNTAFSYTDLETGEERFVSVPEQVSGGLIPADPQRPGVVYTVGLDADTGKTNLFRIEVGVMKGGSRYHVTGATGRAIREAIRIAYDYIRVNLSRFTIERSLDDCDIHVQVVNLMQAKEGSQTGAAFLVAILSGLLDRPVTAGTVILGEMTIQGVMMRVSALGKSLQVIRENGGQRVLVPAANVRDLSTVPPDLLSGLDIAFFSDARECVLKAIAA